MLEGARQRPAHFLGLPWGPTKGQESGERHTQDAERGKGSDGGALLCWKRSLASHTPDSALGLSALVILTLIPH